MKKNGNNIFHDKNIKIKTNAHGYHNANFSPQAKSVISN